MCTFRREGVWPQRLVDMKRGIWENVDSPKLKYTAISVGSFFISIWVKINKAGNCLSQPAFLCNHWLLFLSQTLVCDINAMTRESPHWTDESKLVLESQLLLATEGPLCLDPSIEVAQVANQLQFNKNKFHTRGIRRCVYQPHPPLFGMIVKLSRPWFVLSASAFDFSR